MIVLNTTHEYILSFYEPTDVELSAKPFQTPYWKAVKFVTPNPNELKYMASFLNIPVGTDKTCSNKIEDAANVARKLVNSYVDNVIVTLGEDGVLVARKALAKDPFLKQEESTEVYIRHYPAEIVKDFINVSGAGDCLASGIAAAAICGLSEENCLSVGFAAARKALYSQSAVPKEMFDRTHPAWHSSAFFKTIS